MINKVAFGFVLALAAGMPCFSFAGGGATPAATTVSGGNTPPVINPAPVISLQQGSVPSVRPLATVTDQESPAQDIVVTAVSVPVGLSVSDIGNSNGAISGRIAATCDATLGSKSVALRATDPGALFADTNLGVEVAANTPPEVGFGGGGTVMIGTGVASFSPPQVPTDNGSIVSAVVTMDVDYTGGFSVDAQTGMMTVTNPGPIGYFRFDIESMDNCGLSSSRFFELRVTELSTPPVITVVPVAARINDPPTISTLGSIFDAEDTIAQLDLRIDGNYGSYRNGVRVLDLAVDQNGVVTAELYADCGATNASFELRATDSTTLVSTATLHVDVLPNTPPVLSYNPMVMVAESDAPFAPATGPTDNSGLVFTYWFDYGTYTGVAALLGPPGEGVLYFGDPIGTHTLVIAAQDACLMTTFAELQVTVLAPEIFGDGFEDTTGGLAKIKLPAGIARQVMSMDLAAPILASDTSADAVVDLIEFDVDGHRLLLQAKSTGDQVLYRIPNPAIDFDAEPGAWVAAPGPVRLQWRLVEERLEATLVEKERLGVTH